MLCIGLFGSLAGNGLAKATAKLTPTTNAPIVELRLWNVPRKDAVGPFDVSRRRIFDTFCSRHLNIRFKVLVPLKIEGPAQESNEFLAIAGGVAPDVFYLYGRKVGDYIGQDFLLPLNDFLLEYERESGRRYSGVAAPDCVWEVAVRGGKVYAVPNLYYSMALLCDVGLFAKAGLADKYPRNWDELYEMARHLTWNPAKEPGADPNAPVQYGLAILTVHAGWHFLQYVWSSGGEVVRPYLRRGKSLEAVPLPPIDYEGLGIQIGNVEDYLRREKAVSKFLSERKLPADYTLNDLEWRLVTNEPKAMEALYFFRRLCHQPWLRNGDHEFDITPEMLKEKRAIDPKTGVVFDLADPSVQGRIYYGVTSAAELNAGLKIKNILYAMQIGMLAELPFFSTEYVPVPFPSRTGCEPAAFIAGHYLGINAAIQAEDVEGRRDPAAIQRAAWEYIRFSTGSEAEKIRINTFVEYGLSEWIRPATLVNAGYADLLERIPPERRAFWDQLTAYAHVEPYCKGFTHVMTRELGLVLDAIFADHPDTDTGAFKRDPQQMMDNVCRTVNTMILGQLPEEVVHRRSVAGWIIFGVIAVALVFGARLIIKLAAQAQAKFGDTEGFGVGGHPTRRRLYAWCLLLPAMGTILIWQYYPLGRGLIMAFQDFKILGGSTYVGLRNFVEAVSEPKFWIYLLQTFEYMCLSIGLGFLMPIILAVLLTEIPRGKILFRTVYYLPAVTTGLVTLFLWKNLLYNPQPSGVLNHLLLGFNVLPLWGAAGLKIGVFLAVCALIAGLIYQTARPWLQPRGRVVCGLIALAGIAGLIALLVYLARDEGVSGIVAAFISKFDFEARQFLRDPKLVMLWIVIPTIWAGAGPGCLIYLAALKGIPDEQFEAADLDGAGVWNKAVHVMVPNLKALIIINFVGAVIAGFKESGNIFVMTGGGPEDASMTTGLFIWYNAFMFLNFGLATAMAWIMGALLLGFTLTQLRILNKLQFRSVDAEEKMK